MARRYLHEEKEQAVRDLEGGLKAPVVCRRHGIAERTLYRWQRDLARERLDAGLPPARRTPRHLTPSLCQEALGIALGALAPAERERIVGLLALRLELPPGRAQALLGAVPAKAGGRIGLTIPRRSITAELAERFGKARWILIQGPGGELTFERNRGLTGGAVVAALRAAACEDVVVSSLCTRALSELQAAGIRVWRGVAGKPALDQALHCRRGELEVATEPLVHLGRHLEPASTRSTAVT